MKKIKLITYKIVFVIPLLLWNINFTSQCVDNGNIAVVIDTCADGNNIDNLAYKHIMEYKCNNIKFYYIMNTEYIHLSLSLYIIYDGHSNVGMTISVEYSSIILKWTSFIINSVKQMPGFVLCNYSMGCVFYFGHKLNMWLQKYCKIQTKYVATILVQYPN